MIEFGLLLRQLRTDLGLTLRDLARDAGVNHTYLSKIENGRLEHTPSIRTLQALAKALRVDELKLMEAADKLPPILAPFMATPEGVRFLRRAGEKAQSPQEWKDLLGYLDSRAELPPTRRSSGK
jgi:transcriptional regulator with XRE-family HTH domain